MLASFMLQVLYADITWKAEYIQICYRTKDVFPPFIDGNIFTVYC